MSHDEKIRFLQDIPKETISPTQLAVVMGGKPYIYNLQARNGKLSLPHIYRGRNLRIFKQPVLDLLVGGINYWATKAG